MPLVGTDDISFSWKSNENLVCYDNHKVSLTYNGQMLVIYHHNSLNVNQTILKLAEKMDMDEILDEFESLPDRNINHRATSPLLLKKASDFFISVTRSDLIGSSCR